MKRSDEQVRWTQWFADSAVGKRWGQLGGRVERTRATSDSTAAVVGGVRLDIQDRDIREEKRGEERGTCRKGSGKVGWRENREGGK